MGPYSLLQTRLHFSLVNWHSLLDLVYEKTKNFAQCLDFAVSQDKYIAMQHIQPHTSLPLAPFSSFPAGPTLMSLSTNTKTRKSSHGNFSILELDIDVIRKYHAQAGPTA